MGLGVFDRDRYNMAVKLVAFAIEEEFWIKLNDEEKEAIRDAIYEQTHNASRREYHEKAER